VGVRFEGTFFNERWSGPVVEEMGGLTYQPPVYSSLDYCNTLYVGIPASRVWCLAQVLHTAGCLISLLVTSQDSATSLLICYRLWQKQVEVTDDKTAEICLNSWDVKFSIFVFWHISLTLWLLTQLLARHGKC